METGYSSEELTSSPTRASPATSVTRAKSSSVEIPCVLPDSKNEVVEQYAAKSIFNKQQIETTNAINKKVRFYKSS